jgi:hypothetical protein
MRDTTAATFQPDLPTFRFSADVSRLKRSLGVPFFGAFFRPKSWRTYFFKLPPYIYLHIHTLAGSDLTTHSSTLFGHRRRHYQRHNHLNTPPGLQTYFILIYFHPNIQTKINPKTMDKFLVFN